MSLYKTIRNPFTGDLQLIADSALLKLKGSVDTIEDLPLTGNSENDCYIVKDGDRLYTWNSTESSGTIDKWVDVGSSTSVDWSAITNKPSSSVSAIDNMVDNGVVSELDGDWKKVTKIQYNPSTGNFKVEYDI